MLVLVACEYTDTVASRFRAAGHSAISCDIRPSEGPPNFHVIGDVLKVLEMNEHWDMMIAFPPCTHLAVSGAKHFAKKRADGTQQKAVEFFMRLAMAPIERIAIENPIGIMSTWWRRPDQIVHPYQFGDPYSKATCLWLKGLPLLAPTNIVKPEPPIVTPSGKRHCRWYSNNKAGRDRTFPGIASAMANQWGHLQ